MNKAVTLSKEEKIIVRLFKYLWIIILLPKVLQFVFYGCVLLHFIFRKRIRKFPLSSVFLLGMVCIQGVAICQQCLLGKANLSRFLAALNTAGIWLIAVLLFVYCYTYVRKDMLLLISKYLAFDIGILIFLYFLSLNVEMQTITILGQTYALKRMDYLASGTTTRFAAFTETVLGPSHLFCMGFPISLIYVKKWKSNMVKLAYCVLAYMAVFATHSRIGQLVCAAVLLFGLWYLFMMDSKGILHLNRKAQVCIIIVLAMFCMGFVIQNYESLAVWFMRLLHSRSGSNNARFSIYRESIKMAFQESPIIGIGIKYMLGSFPYGSHCTYIGVFYKTGFAGFICFILGFEELFRKLWKDNIKQYSMIIYSFLLYLVMLIFADIDGSNWSIVSWFVVWGIMSKRTEERNV